MVCAILNEGENMQIHSDDITVVMSYHEAELLGEFLANFLGTDPNKHAVIKTALPRDDGVAPRWEGLRTLYDAVWARI